MIKRKPVATSSPEDSALILDYYFGDVKDTTPDSPTEPTRDITDAVTRKPLAENCTTIDDVFRGPPDLNFVWGPRPQPTVASEFFFFWTIRRIASSTYVSASNP